MATKLKGLKIKRVALVDEGANPDAHIKFAKSKADAPEVDVQLNTEEAIGIFDRFSAFIRKMLSGEKVDKSAFTFAETKTQRNYEKVMSDEIYPCTWAFMDSVTSILNDVEKSDDDKASLLKQTVTEFSEAFQSNAVAWAQALSAGAGIAKDSAVLAKMRDCIDDLIKKADDSGERHPEDDDDDGENPEDDSDSKDKDGDKKDPPVKKGETNMEFDTSKMTPEEKAQFDDLAKRFGKQEEPAPAAAQAPAAVEDSDVVKGMKAELEELRKFRETAEDRELDEIAKRYGLIGKKPEELKPVLKSLKAASQEAFDQFVAGLDEAVAVAEKSGTFDEIGKRGGNASTEDAWGKIEAAAQEIVKAKPDMKWADAVDAACMAHPELVEAYEKSR